MSEITCEKCGGTGWISFDRNGMSGAERCACFTSRLAVERENRSGIPLNYLKASFESWEMPLNNPVARNQLAPVFMGVKKYANEYPLTDKPGLLLLGAPGTGKTHLAIAAMRTLMARGFDATFFDFQTLLEKIQRGWNPNSGTSDRDAYRQAMDVDVLVLDDLGARRSAEWVEDTIAAIVTHRCNFRKPLIATTNLSDTALEEPRPLFRDRAHSLRQDALGSDRGKGQIQAF